MKIRAAVMLIVGIFFIGGIFFYNSTDRITRSAIEYKRPNSEQLRHGCLDWIRKHDVTSFLDELYRLIGHAPEVTVTQKNLNLFYELGFRFHDKQVPFTIPKSAVREVFRETDFNFTITTICEAVLTESSRINIDEATIWYLNWVLASSPRLSTNLVRDEVMGFGWNCELHSSSQPKVPWVTYGAYLCTVILAEGGDGACSGSHYDTLPYNPKQIALLDNFSRQHGGLKRIYLINWRPEHIRIIGEKWPGVELMIANKSDKDVWFIHFSFVNGSVVGRYSKREVSAKWLDSLSPANPAADLRKSMLSFMLPGSEAELKHIEFIKIDPVVFSQNSRK